MQRLKIPLNYRGMIQNSHAHPTVQSLRSGEG